MAPAGVLTRLVLEIDVTGEALDEHVDQLKGRVVRQMWCWLGFVARAYDHVPGIELENRIGACGLPLGVRDVADFLRCTGRARRCGGNGGAKHYSGEGGCTADAVGRVIPEG